MAAVLFLAVAIVAPARVRAQYAWNFVGCGSEYTNDELGFFGGPYLQVFTPEFNGRELKWLEPTSNFVTDPDSWIVSPNYGWVTAGVTLTQAGQYVIILEYTPFVYDVEYREITSPKTESIFFVPYPIPVKDTTIQVVGNNDQPVPAGVEVEFPGWDPDVDPYDAVTDGSGQIHLECVSRARVTFPPKKYDPFPNLLNVFVNDPTYGSFCDWVQVPGTGATIDVKIKPGGCNTQLIQSTFRIGRT